VLARAACGLCMLHWGPWGTNSAMWVVLWTVGDARHAVCVAHLTMLHVGLRVCLQCQWWLAALYVCSPCQRSRSAIALGQRWHTRFRMVAPFGGGDAGG
jgi:hypothetical protein